MEYDTITKSIVYKRGLSMALGKTVEIEISNLKELYEIEREKREYFKSQEIDPYKRSVLFFRGQSDYSWILIPGIKREDNHNTRGEEDLSEWEILEGYNASSDNLFEYIAKCQHYGKKTRFLDFSTDINVALFFACNEKEDTDASLYICPYMPRKSRWSDTVIISELSLLRDAISVGDFANQLYMKYADLRNKFIDINKLSMQIVSWLDHGFIVLPDAKEYEEMKADNPRIYNQKGAFFICGNKSQQPLDSRRSSFYAEYNIILPKVCDVPDTLQMDTFVTKVKIPSLLKRNILDCLIAKGINKEYLSVQ